MRDTKNGSPAKSSPAKKSKSIRAAIKEYREQHLKNLSRGYVLLFLSVIAALLIQRSVGFDYFSGNVLLAAVLLLIFYKDIKRYKPAYLSDQKMLILLGLLVTGTLLVSRTSAYILSGLQRGLALPGGDAFVFGVPIAMGAMLVTLIFDFHTAMIFSFVISLLSGVWIDDPLFTVYAFIGSLTAAFSVIRCKKRSALIKAGLYVSAANIVTAAIILLSGGHLLSAGAPAALLFAALSGVIVAAIVTFVLPAIEYFFGVTTDISLIELLDIEQPLMRQLMITAPGTYHHSIIVGNLAESAAEAVGANPLLARVTAYYHDIGKVKMPEYFVENQANSRNKHEKLTPHMSSLILISHVKEGVELAKQYKMPKAVGDIIQQHHGTSLIAYFYQKALEQAQDSLPLQEDYRYPGPKPQTRVAALVMMADAVEAASRSLTEPTPARISALVEKIINNIFLDGQIDECELTLKDISEIKRRFTYVLTSIFHRRIAYPELDVKTAHKMERPPEAGTVKPPADRVPAAPASERTGTPPNGNGNSGKEPAKNGKDIAAEDREGPQERSHLPGA